MKRSGRICHRLQADLRLQKMKFTSGAVCSKTIKPAKVVKKLSA